MKYKSELFTSVFVQGSHTGNEWNKQQGRDEILVADKSNQTLTCDNKVCRYKSSDVPAWPESRKPAQAEPSEAKPCEAIAGLGVACSSGFTSSKPWAVAWATALWSW